MNIFLRAKHWQLFIALMGSFILSQSLITNSMSNGGFLGITVYLFCLVYFGWLWSISMASYKALPVDLASSPKLMKFGLVYASTYLVLADVFYFSAGKEPPTFVVVLHLLAMIAIFYALAFTAKQLTKLDQNKQISFYSYSGPFFLLWFFPIGVWFVQPKVNQLLDKT